MEVVGQDAEQDMEMPTTKSKGFKQERYRSVVPWHNPEQFVKVYECLYSSSISDKRWAVDEISVWETRCHPSLPTAIEATAVLVRAKIQDMLFQVEKTFCQEKDIQMLFAMALVRFVNLTLEIDQNSQFKMNMSALADKRNIPKWIVDLRHEVSHAILPSLPVLRMGAETALNYLEESFWRVEASNIRPIVKSPTGIEETVQNVIGKYKNAQINTILEIGNKKKNEKDIKEIILEIHSLVKAYGQKFVVAFLQPGVFLCPKDIVQLVENRDQLYLEEEDDLALPDVLEKVWLAVFRIFHTSELIPTFMELLLLSQESHTHMLCKKAAVSFAIYLLNATEQNDKSLLSVRFQATGVQLNIDRLLYSSMKGANRFTVHFFNKLLKRVNNLKKYKEVCCIMAMSQGMFLPNDDSEEEEEPKDAFVFTVEDLETDLEGAKKPNQMQRKHKNIWSLAPVHMDFSNMPLGTIINEPVKDENSDSSIKENIDLGTCMTEPFVYSEKYIDEPVIKEEPDKNILFSDPELGDMLYYRV